jgi:hypothetical protein
MDAFDADVLIYAAVPGHPVGRRVAALFDNCGRRPGGGWFGTAFAGSARQAAARWRRGRGPDSCWPAGQARPASGRSRDGGVGHCAVRQVPAARGRSDPPGDGRRPRRGRSSRTIAAISSGRSGRSRSLIRTTCLAAATEGSAAIRSRWPRTAYCDRFRWPIVSASRSQSGANAR